MLKNFSFLMGIMLLLLSTNLVFAQNISISGSVTDKMTKEVLPGASITVKGRTAGTTTDENGRFTLAVDQAPPFTIVVSYIGYKPFEEEVSGSETNLTVELEQGIVLGQEVVIAASRAPERIIESPVSIESVNALTVRESAAPSFYDALVNLKGVESSVQSLTFRSISTRGFNANGNVRFNQYVDGMDNQAPGLNFSVGNIVGLSDLDVAGVELLPGASSALYGAGGTNGTMLMTSRNPFDYPGLSMSFKLGMNHIDNLQTKRSPYEDMALRYAKAWNNKLAFKINLSYLTANDWEGQDYSDFDRLTKSVKPGDRSSDPAYDGVNVYGDEPNAKYPTPLLLAQAVQSQTRAGILAGSGGTLDIVAAMNAALPANATQTQINAFIGSLPAALRPAVTTLVPFYFGLRNNVLPNTPVTRTGYLEKDLVDYDSKSIKTSGAIHYKITNSIEAIAQANWGTGTSVYTGSDRYSLRDFNIGQYKLELKGNDFFLRGYTTKERAGQAYNSTLLGTYINEYTNPSSVWFPEYTAAYSSARLSGLNDAQASVAARQYADRNRAQPGSALFETTKEFVTSRTIGPAGGARFLDKSNLYHYEGMYNFTNLLNGAVEFQVGSSYRIFQLRSDGTIFDDLNRNLTIPEFGAFVQLGKKFMNDKLKLTGAARYDKNENFEGRFTPRVSAVYTVAKNNNIRASYQTGFRNPTTQNQYIDLTVGGATGVHLIGGLPELINKYKLNTNKGYTLGSVSAGAPEQYTFGTFKPESVNAYEIGYKGLLKNRLLIDASYYYNAYKDFISTIVLLQAPDGTPATLTSATTFTTAVNNPDKVSSKGAAVGFDYLSGKYTFTGNLSYNELNDNNSAALSSEFNTPKYRFNVGLSNTEIIKNVGFNISYRWQDKFTWSSTFATGEIPAFSTVDAQVSYKIPAYKTILKLGASDLFNHYYRTSYGNPATGGLYYVSLLFDQFLR